MSDKKVKSVGSKAEVYHGSAVHTPGGLKKKDLMKTKRGRIVSRKQHAQGKKSIKRLFALGYKPKKGTFKAMRKSMVDGRRHKKGTKKHSKKRGGFADAVAANGKQAPVTSASVANATKVAAPAAAPASANAATAANKAN
jgi:hypothetical protein